MNMTEKICGALTRHRCCVKADGGYRICRLCGRVWKEEPVAPLPRPPKGGKAE